LDANRKKREAKNDPCHTRMTRAIFVLLWIPLERG
jgi:hypothetical protein